MFRRVLRVLFWLFLLVAGAGLAYSFTDAFGARWRGFVLDALAERGVHADFGRFSLHPLEGLVASEVKIFSDESRQLPLMSIDRISLDLDQGRLLERKVFINGIDVTGGTLALPLNPSNPDSTRLELRDLEARILLEGGQLQILKASGTLAGLSVTIQGNIQLPPKKLRKPGEEEPKPKLTTAERIAMVQAQRGHIENALKWINRFSFATPPKIEIQINAEAERMEQAVGRATFQAQGAAYGSYSCTQVSARVDYDAGDVQLRQLLLKDALGTFDGSGTWRRGDEAAEFRVLSTGDLAGLAKAVFDSDALKEVVFYQSTPPTLALEGRWYVEGPRAGTAQPADVLGSFQCDRFTTRGEVFDGVNGKFGLDAEGFYFRDGLLRHEAGTLAFQIMKRARDGLRYQAALKMEPRAFLPFIERKEQRELIERFGFHERSSIFVLLDGYAADGNPRHLHHTGKAELKAFTFRGMDVVSGSADVDVLGRVTTLSNIKLERPQGSGQARSVVINGDTRQVILTGVSGTLDPVPIVACFAPEPAKHISKYGFSADTTVEMSGIVGMKKEIPCDFTVNFRSPRGSARYQLWGKDYRIAAPTGTISYQHSTLQFDVKGSVFDGPLHAQGKVSLNSRDPGYEVSLRSARFPFDVLGKDVPFEDLKADVTSGSGRAPFQVSANLLGGTFSMEGALDLSAKPHPYRGQVNINGVSFKRFAQIYAPTHESEGDLTGHFNFTGILDDWRALKGNGVTIILNGNLYALPILGPLTPLLGALLPSPIRGYNIAKEANCTFRVADGFIVTDDIEALTSTFRLVSSGSIDFLQDQIDFNAQARVRGLPGLVLRPVSQLLEFKGEGTVRTPQWKPHLFGLTNTSEGRRPPSKEELDATLRANGTQPEPEKKSRNPFNLFNRK
jgi:hypothetical protein